MTDGAMLTEILEALEIPCDKCSFHGKLDAFAAGLDIDTEGRLLGDVLDDIAAKEGIQRDNRLYGAFIRKLYDYITNGEDVTLTGNPLVLVNSMGRPLKECVVSWEPTQEGSGEPYPAGGGPNLLDISGMEKKTQNGVTFELKNGGIWVHGTATANTDSPTFDVSFLKPGDYYGWAITNVAQVLVVATASDPNGFWFSFGASKLTIQDTDTPKYYYFVINAGVTIDAVIYPQICTGGVPASYYPYSNIRPISRRGTVRVERCGENLLDLSQLKPNGYNLAGNNILRPNTTYTFKPVNCSGINKG